MTRADTSSSRTRTTRGWPAAPPGCCGPSTRPACSTPPTCTSRSGCAPLAAEDDELVALAVAFVVRAVRGGSVCVDLATVADERRRRPALAGRRRRGTAALAASPLVTAEPPVLRLLEHDGVRLLYLDRYWREEEQVHADLVGRPAGVGRAATRPGWRRRSTGSSRGTGYDEQRAAARVALTHATTVLTGGPGTGKTTTVAALLALCAEQAELAGEPALRIALAAPTGKAAARLQQAVEDGGRRSCRDADRARLAGVRAVTLHRLLGARPDTSSRFRHHRDNRLPHDVVVVDETSMVSLTMMARLLEAVRPGSRLILVGDPFQLASVEAGAVLADLVETVQERTRVGVAALRHLTPVRRVHRRAGRGRARRATPTGPSRCSRPAATTSSWSTSTTPRRRIRALVAPHALGVLRGRRGRRRRRARWRCSTAQRLLCAHREGPYGVRHWNRQVERWLGEETGEPHLVRPGTPAARSWSPPTTTASGIYNGDTGVAVRPAVGAPAGRCARGRRQHRPPRPRHQPARPGRDACTR